MNKKKGYLTKDLEKIKMETLLINRKKRGVLILNG